MFRVQGVARALGSLTNVSTQTLTTCDGGAASVCMPAWHPPSHQVVPTSFTGCCVQASAFGAAPVVWEVSATANPSPLAAHIPAGLAPARRPRSEPLAAFTRAKAEPAAAARGLTAATGMGLAQHPLLIDGCTTSCTAAASDAMLKAAAALTACKALL